MPTSRRPRATPPCHRCAVLRASPARPRASAFALPPPVFAGVLAVVSVSVTLALNTLLSPRRAPRRHPLHSVTRLTHRLRQLLPRAPPPAPAPAPAAAPSTPPPLDPSEKLDSLRDRAVAQLDNERLAFASALSHDDFVQLPPLQRRELLATAFAEIANAPPAPRPRRNLPLEKKAQGVVQEKKTRVAPLVGERAAAFWRVAESVNGRAAALGFVVCLAREVVEPGHPSLVDQVVGIVVPIAQKTPPFLVAVVDQIVDLLT